MNQFVLNFGAAQSTTASSSVAYSRVSGPPPIQLDTGWHVHAPRPHLQHQEVTVSAHHELETLDPTLPLDWIAVVPVAAIVAAHIVYKRRARFAFLRFSV